jgi:hypothetical protein
MAMLFDQRQGARMLQAGCLLSSLGMLCVAFHVHRYAARRSQGIALFMSLAHALAIAALLAIAFRALGRRCWLRVAYLLCNSLFYGLLAWVAQKERSLRTWLRRTAPFVLVPLLVAALFLAGREPRILELIGFLTVHFQYLPAGIAVLGGRFMPLKGLDDRIRISISTRAEL